MARTLSMGARCRWVFCPMLYPAATYMSHECVPWTEVQVEYGPQAMVSQETRTRARTAIRYSAKVVAVGCRRSVGGKREDEDSGCKPGTYFLLVDLVCAGCAAGGSSGPNAAEIRILPLAPSTVLRS